MAFMDDLVTLGLWPALAAKLATPTLTAPNIGAATGTSLVLTGAATVGGLRLPVATVAAAGANQGNAAALAEGISIVTGADDTKGVKLPTAVAGMVVIVKVGDGADLKIWPATGAAINAITADSAMTVVDDVCLMLVATSATQWYTVPLLPS